MEIVGGIGTRAREGHSYKLTGAGTQGDLRVEQRIEKRRNLRNITTKDVSWMSGQLGLGQF